MKSLNSTDLVRPPREIDIVDKHGEKFGLSLTVVPETDDRYQRVFRAAADELSSPKKVPKKRKRELNERLFMARIKDWSWSGKALEQQGGEAPEFNATNLHNLLYEQGEVSAAIRMQVQEEMNLEQEVFSDE